MEDVNISKYRAQVVRAGSTPASPGFVVSEGQNPVDPSGSGQNHLPVTIATAATGLSITESQVLGGAGTVGQYIRGDGSLADFPATTGGGSSVSYYLNGSVSQGTIGGVAYKELNRTPVFGTGTDISINADGYIASFITDALDPNKLLIPGGNWNFETYFSASSSGGNPSFYIELYKYDGTTFTLLATSSSAPELIAFGTNLNPYFSTLAVPETVLALTDRLAVRFYVTHSGRTITLHTEDNHLCQVITTFTTGLTALNGLTSQVQFFAVGTSGTDFAISSASDTHTFNLPTASATNRGALSSADWTTFNNKQNALTLTTTGTSGAATLVGSTLNIPQYQAAGTYVTAVTASSPLFSSGGTTPNITIQQATATQNGFLSSTDWTTFNSKQNALTNPVTGTGTSGQIAYFNGTSAITGESGLVWDATNNYLSIGGATANSNLTVSGSDNSIIFSVLAGVNSRLHVGTVSSGTITYVRSQNNYALNLGVNTTDYLSISTAGNSTFTGNIILANGVNRFVRIGSATNYNYDLQTTGEDFQIIEAGGSLATARLTIKFPNGNVGINTTTPATTLEVNGVGLFSGTSLVGNTKNGLYIYDQAIISLGGTAARPLTIQSQTLSIYTGATYSEKFKIFENGNVVISTSPTDAGYKLDVNGAIRSSDEIYINNGKYLRLQRSSGGLYIQTLGIDSGTDNVRLLTTGDFNIVNGSLTNLMTVKNGGNVLIGTTTDAGSAQKLQVVTTGSSNYLRLQTDNNASYDCANFFTDGTNSVYAGMMRATSGLTGAFSIFAGGSVRVNVTAGGSVGINNSTPMNTAWGTDASTKQLSIDASSYAVINLTGSTSRKYSMGVGDGNFYMCYDNTANRHNLTVASGGNVLIGTTTAGASKLRIVGLPTSAAGLSSGDVYNLSGVLMIA